MDSEFAGLRLEIPDGWFDTTDELPPDAPPTLTPEDGCGALQFTVAKYKSGKIPNVTVEDLKKLLRDFCEHHSLGPVKPAVISLSRTPCVGAIVSAPDGVVGFYYLSDGRNIAVVTYSGMEPGHPSLEEELPVVVGIIKSIRFA
jgi:hypothetical protein